MRFIRVIALTASVTIMSGCAHKAVTNEPDLPLPGVDVTHGDSRNINETELAAATQLNLLDYLKAERPNWLVVRNAGSSRNSSQGILVYINETRLGSPETLRGISLRTVRALHYFDASAAQSKFATRDANGVIQVIMR